MASTEVIDFWKHKIPGETEEAAEWRRMVDEPFNEVYPDVYQAFMRGTSDAMFAVECMRQVMCHSESTALTFDDALDIWNKSPDNPERNQGEQ